ncbi:MAG TPA: DUF4390 domain-containing protein [Syntrophobacteria bacterium]|nr:DUF4390 domain-containing protein [Syntrophobacteria bacterium]
MLHRGAEATLSDIIVTNTREDLLAFFEIRGCFTREMDEAILNGIPTTFTIFVKLTRARLFWVDQSLSTGEIEHSIKYDSLRSEFQVRRTEDGGKVLVCKDFPAAKKAMAEVKGVKVAPLQSLVRGNKYQLRVKAELQKVRLPLNLHYVLFFLSLWDFETDWYTVDFTY